MISEGQVVDGKYRVVKLLGSGGMGAVYLAEHLVIGRRVALKVLLGSVAGNETAVARFEREAQAAGRIGNDHILEVFDFGALPDGSRYMVCEFLDGETLADRLEREQRIAPAALLSIARQLLSGLEAAHQAGVVHRDLKPENVFILRQKAGLADFVKIIDFGISKFQPLSTGEGMQMTATGIVVGTPCYLSPEQARGSREADARSDLYAVGVILYECVTGKLPFTAANVNDLLFKIVLESPVPVRQAAPDLDAGFAQIIECAMARDPDHRFQSAAAFVGALDKWASDHGVTPSFRTNGPFAPDGSVAAKSADAVKVPSGATRSLAPTPGTWADSQISVAAFKPRRSKLLPIALASVAVLGGGLALALLRSGAHTDAGIASSAVASAPPGAGTSSARPAEVDGARPPNSTEPIAPSSPELKVPPVSSEAVKALLEPSVAPVPQPPTPAVRPTVTPKPHRPASGGGGVKVSGSTAPPAPAPAAEVPAGKKRRDFGY